MQSIKSLSSIGQEAVVLQLWAFRFLQSLFWVWVLLFHGSRGILRKNRKDRDEMASRGLFQQQLTSDLQVPGNSEFKNCTFLENSNLKCFLSSVKKRQWCSVSLTPCSLWRLKDNQTNSPPYSLSDNSISFHCEAKQELMTLTDPYCTAILQY